MKNTADHLDSLYQLIKKLRSPEGCPWDRKQTIESFQPYLIEELHELLEAIGTDDPEHIKEELGDLLFQILFINNLYEEKGAFDLNQVMISITQKMIRRHPHVFEGSKIRDEKDLRKNWNRIKNEEKRATESPATKLFSYPKSLPALLRAQRVSSRAVSSGFEWPDLESVFDKLAEELSELHHAFDHGTSAEIEDEIGDVLFTMVNIARKSGFDAEQTLQKSTDKFINRFECLAGIASTEGKVIEELNIDEMQRLWQQAKALTTKKGFDTKN
ncbi:MAG: nucleoside triphosphate pyrophosphohydrolase [Proteobacteria bacterium]|nr:nucleoside triphosphate pyrophosphohydrolase [Pseudomonadota bacterium]MBU1688063.1 nucleoside triphosphate pyrophosphohydrolase [Pseudomonadota bacterium]